MFGACCYVRGDVGIGFLGKEKAYAGSGPCVRGFRVGNGELKGVMTPILVVIGFLSSCWFGPVNSLKGLIILI